MVARKVKEEFQYPNGLTLPESGAVLLYISVVFVYNDNGDRVINSTNKIMGVLNDINFNFTVQPSEKENSVYPSVSTDRWPYGLSFEALTKEFIDFVTADTNPS